MPCFDCSEDHGIERGLVIKTVLSKIRLCLKRKICCSGGGKGSGGCTHGVLDKQGQGSHEQTNELEVANTTHIKTLGFSVWMGFGWLIVVNV